MTDNGSFHTKYRVLYGDVDAMGVMYHGNYFRLFERGRAEYIRERGLTYKDIEDRGVFLPVSQAQAHYLQPARYDDLVLIECRPGQIKRASLRFDYRIFRDRNKTELLVEGHTLHACTNTDGKVIRLPEFLLSICRE